MLGASGYATQSGTTEETLLTVTLPANAIVTGRAVRFRIDLYRHNASRGATATFNLKADSSTIMSATNNPGSTPDTNLLFVHGMLYPKGAVTAQGGWIGISRSKSLWLASTGMMPWL